MIVMLKKYERAKFSMGGYFIGSILNLEQESIFFSLRPLQKDYMIEFKDNKNNIMMTLFADTIEVQDKDNNTLELIEKKD